MIRTFIAAFVTIIAVSTGALEAQGRGAPVTVVGAAPGVTVQFFMDAGKLADATVDTTGSLSWVLDLSNTPKTRVTIYVDVCKDGKIVKVMFVTGSGQAPPEDDDCRRRLAAVSFQSDCAKLHVNLDFSNFAASKVIGCGFSFTNPKVIGTVGGVLIGTVALTTGGGGGSTTPTALSPPTVTTVTQPPVNTSAPPTTTAPPSTPPSSPPPVTANGNYVCVLCSIRVDVSNHNGTLRVCNGVTATFTVIEGSLTIRHPAPFIEVSGPNYNTSTGAFDLTGRGSVAGFNNVTVRAVGTVNNTTGRITFDYTMGTAGEFPGGQPITYSVTLQKQ